MPQQWNIKAGDLITIRSEPPERIIIYEGTVVELKERAGTEVKQFICDPPHIIERLRPDDDVGA